MHLQTIFCIYYLLGFRICFKGWWRTDCQSIFQTPDHGTQEADADRSSVHPGFGARSGSSATVEFVTGMTSLPSDYRAVIERKSTVHTYDLYQIHISLSSHNRYKLNSLLTYYQQGFIAQLL